MSPAMSTNRSSSTIPVGESWSYNYAICTNVFLADFDVHGLPGGRGRQVIEPPIQQSLTSSLVCDYCVGGTLLL